MTIRKEIPDLEKEIKQKEMELKELKDKKLSNKVKKKTDYTDKEKIKWFDETYDMMMEELKEHLENDYEDEDAEHYDWEHLLEILGKDIWVIWNRK